MDILAALDVASAVAGKQDFGTTVGDLRLLWGVYNGGKPDVLGIVKSGKLTQVLDALSRTVAVLDVVAKDPAHSASVVSLLESLAPAGA